MKHLFIPYELALIAKQKGFSELCLYAWCEKNGGWNKYAQISEPIALVLKTDGNPFGSFFSGKNWNTEITPNTKNKIQCSAPMYQQIIDWFRDKHQLHFYIVPYGDCESWTLANIGRTNKKTNDGRLDYVVRDKYSEVKFKSYYEALNTAITEAFKLI